MASNMVRITGMNSGMDTESIISAYTSTQRTRVQDAKDSLKMNEWKQDAWKSLNTKIYSFYSKTLSTNRLSNAYSKTKTTTSNSALSVVSGSGAATGTQNAKIISTAAAGYMTSAKVDVSSGSDNLIEKLGSDIEGKQIKVKLNSGAEQTIQIGGTSDDENVKVVNTMDELANAIKDTGLAANFDAANQRLFVNAKSTGENNDFNITGDADALKALGLDTSNGAVKTAGSSAELELNGARFKSDSNSFVINGSTYTINHMPTNPDENIAISTTVDYDGVYDVVKDMLKEYNDLVNEMSKLYNAASAKGYKPLTDEQKDAMSEKEIEEWENKIKDSLLKGDSTVNDVMMKMINSTTKGFEIDGKTTYLADFGISTLGYFEAEANERYALHIDGNTDDGITGSKEDKLKAMIASDPEKVTKFFTSFANDLYQGLYSMMGSSKLSSIYKVYNDKELKTENDDWKKKIAELESKLTDMEDKYYKKFATMETTLSKINSKNASFASFFGGQ